MEYEEKKQRIISWLQINSLLEKFMHNQHKLKPDFDPFAEEELNEFLIAKSFVWVNTTEGTGFWNDVDDKYKEFYNNYIMKEEKEKSIKIDIPEGYEIDKEKSTFENIIFKKKEAKPWRKESHNIDGYYINNIAKIAEVIGDVWKPINFNIFATEKQAKSALAMAQISQIMANDPRFGGPVTDKEWLDHGKEKYVIFRNCRDYDNIAKETYLFTYAFLAFHTPQQRYLFLKENEDLVKQYLMLD
jgi:hypothetical protein